jgi:hypothetical protein
VEVVPIPPSKNRAWDGHIIRHGVTAVSQTSLICSFTEGDKDSQEEEIPRKRKAKASLPKRAPKAAKAKQRQPSLARDQASAQFETLPLSGGRQSVRYVVKSSFAPDVIARAAGTERHGRTGDGPMHEDENAPENETPEQKRLRRNRINERRKRARRAMKVDYINEVCQSVALCLLPILQFRRLTIVTCSNTTTSGWRMTD